MSDKLWSVLERGTDEFGPFGHGWTYSAHPIGAAAGVANLELLDRLDLVRNAGEVGAYLPNFYEILPHAGKVGGAPQVTQNAWLPCAGFLLGVGGTVRTRQILCKIASRSCTGRFVFRTR